MQTTEKKNFNPKIIFWIVVVIVAFIVVSSCFTIIGPSERGVKVTLGEVEDQVYQPGIVWTIPFVTTVKTFVLQPRTYEVSFDVGANGAITKDMQTVGATVSVRYFYDENRILEYIQENLGTTGDEACVYLALARHCKLEVAEILDIEEDEYQEHCYKVQGNDYYAGTEEELEVLAMSRLTDDKSIWIEAIKAGTTTDSLDDWAQYVLDMDGWANILNSYDGTSEEYDFITRGYLDTTICVCRT